MQYAIYKNERLRRVLTSLLCFLLLLFMANIVVQNICVQKANASVALAVYLVEHGLAYLAVLLGISGVVYADMNSPGWSIQNPVDAFVSFVEQFYDDYMKQDIINFLESFQANGYTTYADIPQDIRQCFLDFARAQAEAINTNGEFGFENPWTGNVVATTTTGPIMVEYIPCNVGVGMQYTITRCDSSVFTGHATGTYPDQDGSVSNYFDRWQILYYGNDSSVNANQVEIQYYMRSNGSYGWQHLYSAPYPVTYNDETGEYSHLIIVVGDHSVSIYQDVNGTVEFKENLFPQQDREDRWTDFTGHSDVYMHVNNSTVNIVSADAGIITGDQVIDDGQAWREENAEVLEYPVIPPWVELGQETINLPTGIEDITGEGTTVGDVTAPLDTPTDYSPDTDYPYADTPVADIPADIPLETDGTWTQKLIKPFTAVKTKFPFSLPWDIKNILDYFDRYEEQAPEYEFSLSEFYLPSIKGSIGFDKTLSFNLDFLDPYLPFIRFMEIAIADLILIMWLLRHFVSG